MTIHRIFGRSKRWAVGSAMLALLSASIWQTATTQAAPPDADIIEKQKRLKAELDKLAPAAPVPNFELDLDAQGVQKQIEEALLQMNRLKMPVFPNAPRQVKNPRLGVQIAVPSPELVDQLDLPQDQGLVIQEIIADSPAEKAGLKKNDILMEIGGKKVPTTREGLVALLAEFKADTPLAVKVIRKGRVEKLGELKLAKAEEPIVPRAFPGLQGGFNPFGGGVMNGTFNSMSVQISNDDFTINASNNGREFTLVGKKDGAAKTLASIKIKDGDKSLSYDKLEDVPAEYAGMVTKLLGSVK